MLVICNSPDYNKEHDDSKLNIFKKKGLQIFHLNIGSLLPKIDETCFFAKQSNVLIIEINELKLDSSILNSEVGIMGYDAIRIERLRRGGRVACYIKKSLSCNYNSILRADIESIFIDIFCKSQFW